MEKNFKQKKQINPNSLANLKPFVKGISGNPGGKSENRLPMHRGTIAKKWLAAIEKGKDPISGELLYLSQEDIGTLSLIKKMRSGDVSAYNALMDSAYGKARQTTEITGADGDAIEMKITGMVIKKD